MPVREEKYHRDEGLETLTGIVERITYHNPENGWSVLKVSSFSHASRFVTVVIHQAKVFAGATMEFKGSWTHHPKHGEQFKVVRAIEKKPASSAALEKYLGSGLIKGVGPATAKRIVSHFKESTLEVFESKMEELLKVPGIAEKKLSQIRDSWLEHKAIRDVMIFLQGHGISTLFAVKIYKAYGDRAIQVVSENPYRLAQDIYGIGFFSADKIALSMGFATNGVPRIEAGIRHVLAAARESGHCYLTQDQVEEQTISLLAEVDQTNESPDQRSVLVVLLKLLGEDQIKKRVLTFKDDNPNTKAEKTAPDHSVTCFYSKSLYFDELTVARAITSLLSERVIVDSDRVSRWISKYCEKHSLNLSEEQRDSISGIVKSPFSVLTGGPGCGKTTTTRVLVSLLVAMEKKVLLAAPTGRAAQRMAEVIGVEAKTLHRLLEWNPQINGFKKNQKEPLDCDFLIIDECSMLDISLAAAVMKALTPSTQLLFIGDPDQLPAVGAGNVLADCLRSERVPRFRLTQIFRQAEQSSIIRFAHQINRGITPKVVSPFAEPLSFKEGVDCLFIDSDEATVDQLRFLSKAKAAIEQTLKGNDHVVKSGEKWLGRMIKSENGIELDSDYFPDINTNDLLNPQQDHFKPVLNVPEKFQHVDLVQLAKAQSGVSQLFEILKTVHPWSSLHFGQTAVDMVTRLYTKTIPEWLGKEAEVQVLTPQVRGTLGTLNLNLKLQEISNPLAPGKKQLQIGERLFRIGDRVIQTRNNYDLGVFNGDIGFIKEIDFESNEILVQFGQLVSYGREELSELSLAYAITVHKAQGSEFAAVILPIMSQHFNMLFRNLVYTGLTRAKKLAVFVGSRRAFALAVKQIDNKKRQTALAHLLDGV